MSEMERVYVLLGTHASQVHVSAEERFSARAADWLVCIVFGEIFSVSYRGERRYFAREPKGFFKPPFIKNAHAPANVHPSSLYTNRRHPRKTF